MGFHNITLDKISNVNFKIWILNKQVIKMKWSKGVILSLFTTFVTFIAICLNWSKFFMGNYATVLNFIVSTVFISLWLVFSFCWGIKQEKVFL
mgnify:CR=1 FL=1